MSVMRSKDQYNKVEQYLQKPRALLLLKLAPLSAENDNNIVGYSKKR